MVFGVNEWLDYENWLDKDDVDIDAYVDSITETTIQDLSKKLKQWKDNGIVVFKDVIDKRLIDELIEDITHLQSNNKSYDLGVELKGYQGKN